MVSRDERTLNEKGAAGVDIVMRWILFSILLVVIPPLFVVLYRLIVGFDFTYNEYVPDVLTTLVALCCNFINLCVDSDSRVKRLLRWGLSLLVGIVGFGALGLYLVLRIANNQIDERVLKVVFLIAALTALFCALFGTIIQIYTVYCKKKEVK